jgi:hypothetical protein
VGGSDTLVIHAEVLPAEQLACLRRLGPAAIRLGFHLAGGTAVALQCGHRQSIDFDWFTPRFPGSPVDLAETLRHDGIHLETSGIADRTVHGHIGGVKVSFFEFRPPLLRPLVAWTECGCLLAAREDLAAMKLLAVAQRGTKKDFIDLHALSHDLSLEVMIDCYQRRFGVTEASRVLAGLCYFDDAEHDPMPRMLAPTTWSEVKDDLRAMIRRLSR